MRIKISVNNITWPENTSDEEDHIIKNMVMQKDIRKASKQWDQQINYTVILILEPFKSRLEEIQNKYSDSYLINVIKLIQVAL